MIFNHIFGGPTAQNNDFNTGAHLVNTTASLADCQRLSKSAAQRATEGHATKNCFIAMFHAILYYLPFQDVRIYIPEAIAQGMSATASRQLCPYRQHPFIWDSVRRTSIWSHSSELAAAFTGVIRILVIVADQGTEIWGMVQAACLMYGMRLMYLPDPLHGLSGVFANVIRAIPRYFKSCMGVVYTAKYTRAPYGSCRMFLGMQQSISWLLKTYKLSGSPMDTFTEGIASDVGRPAHELTDNLEELRRILTAFTFHPTGPRVELRRWLTWISAT